MEEINDFIEKINSMPDYELKKQLSYGKESYRDGYYELLEEELKNRNIEIFEETIEETKLKIVKNKGINIAKIGYFFAIMGGFIGLIISIYLLASKKYDKNIKKHGIIILSLGLFMMIIGWRLIVFLIKLIINLLS